jgi:hypothetical protein
MTLEFSGPIEDALSRVVSRIGFRLMVSGKAPVSPLIVRVKKVARPALEVLRDIGLQTGPDIGLVVESAGHAVKLSYGSGSGK